VRAVIDEVVALRQIETVLKGNLAMSTHLVFRRAASSTRRRD
jgi:hypothetical protein